MAWVQRGPNSEKLANILASHSLNPEALKTHVALYRAVMFGESPLTRAEREAIAVTVSAANGCHYWLVHHGGALTRESGESTLPETVASGRFDELPPRMRELCRYAVKLTLRPDEMLETDIQALRAVGLDDRAVVDANQAVAYFNYINRIADGLGVELEAECPPEAHERHASPLSRRGRASREVRGNSLEWISVDQMREVDRLAVRDFGVTLDRMMENAGRNMASLVLQFLETAPRARSVIVLAGPGRNGGGGMATARHLHSAGASVRVVLSAPPEQLTAAAAGQYRILLAEGVPMLFGEEEMGEPELVVDAMLGYGQTGAPRGQAARLISWASGRRVLSLDVPSGLELSSGVLHNLHVRAAATVTLALPKQGLRKGAAAVGDLYLADISIPPATYQRLGIPYTSPFGAGPLLRITD